MTDQSEPKDGLTGGEPRRVSGAVGDGSPRKVDVLAEVLGQQEQLHRSLDGAVRNSRDLTDRAAKLRKMMQTFGAALEQEISGRMMGEMQGLRFWQIKLEDLSEEVREEARQMHDRLRAVKAEKPDLDALLRDVLTYLLNRSSQDRAAGELADRIIGALCDETLCEERGDGHE